MGLRIATLAVAVFTALMSLLAGVVAIGSGQDEAWVLDRVGALDSAADLQLDFEWLDAQTYRILLYGGYSEELYYLGEDIDYQCGLFEEDMGYYEAFIATVDSERIFNEVETVYYNRYKPGILTMLERARSGIPPEFLSEDMDVLVAAYMEISEDLQYLRDFEASMIDELGNQSFNDYNNASFVAVYMMVFSGMAFVALIALAAVGLVSEIRRRREARAQFMYPPYQYGYGDYMRARPPQYEDYENKHDDNNTFKQKKD